MALKGKTIEEKLRLNVVREGDCLRWTGAHTRGGYGKIGKDGRTVQTHRLAYELFVGPIPEGLQIDHVHARGCRFHDCINVDHLQPVTPAENMRRTIEIATHCPKGHEYTPENSVYESNGTKRTRRCRTCYRAHGPLAVAA